VLIHKVGNIGGQFVPVDDVHTVTEDGISVWAGGKVPTAKGYYPLWTFQRLKLCEFVSSQYVSCIYLKVVSDEAKSKV
jgi:hypothetical protein